LIAPAIVGDSGRDLRVLCEIVFHGNAALGVELPIDVAAHLLEIYHRPLSPHLTLLK
jgi:hypothetical protein